MDTTKSHGKTQKYIFVTGGVLSGVGKGITAASIGAVLQAKGVNVSIQKCDPYLNVDAGLLNPVEHGECFVTKDGAETDLDLGHYERFLDIELTQKNASLAGSIMSEMIASERAGKLSGKTVQMVPHFTNAIQQRIKMAAKGSDVHIVEIGGTVGDYEGLAFIEAIREFGQKVGRKNCLYMHVVYVPFIGTSKEFKTKPAQNALQDLRSFGIFPDSVIVRTEHAAPKNISKKISVLTGIPEEFIVDMPNVDTVYRIPQTIAISPLHELLAKFTGIRKKPDLKKWDAVIAAQNSAPEKTVRVGLVAKYMDNEDTYISVTEALKAAAWHENVSLKIKWIDAEKVIENDFESVDGILVPGGFGERGVEGKIAAANFALKHKTPYLGLCLGLQAAVIAAARNTGLDDANSSEFNPDTKHDVVYIMEGQAGKESTGGTLRLGDYPARLEKNSISAKLYSETDITERHRHRYEVNKKFARDIENGGLKIVGTSPDKTLVEFVEASEDLQHPFFVATQAHPEFKSRPFKAHPLFVGFIQSLC